MELVICMDKIDEQWGHTGLKWGLKLVRTKMQMWLPRKDNINTKRGTFPKLCLKGNWQMAQLCQDKGCCLAFYTNTLSASPNRENADCHPLYVIHFTAYGHVPHTTPSKNLNFHFELSFSLQMEGPYFTSGV